jgi:hypothetical protein
MIENLALVRDHQANRAHKSGIEIGIIIARDHFKSILKKLSMKSALMGDMCEIGKK